jgi:hypothetical protein
MWMMVLSVRGDTQQDGVASAGRYVPAPKDLPAFPGLERARPKTPVQGGGGLRKRWVDDSGGLYEWDSQHGTVERYNRAGKHIGEFAPNTGEQTKPADETSRPNQENRTMTTQSVSRWIRGYDKNQGKLVLEYQLPESLTLERLQLLFQVSTDNPMFDCFPVEDSVARVLEEAVGASLLCDERELFLEADAD